MSLQEVSHTDELESMIESTDSLMVVFSKEQCPACNTMGQWLDQQFTPNPDNSGVKVVIAKLEKLGRRVVEDFSLRTMPTTLLFRRGDEVYRVPGFTNAAPVESAVNAHLRTA
jgi:thioredoxin-related protein